MSHTSFTACFALLAFACGGTAPASAPTPPGLEPHPALKGKVKQLVGSPHGATCALLESGEVACWGCSERHYQSLAEPNDLRPTTGRHARPAFTPLRDVRELGLTEHGACALDGSGSVACWGGGFWGPGLTACDQPLKVTFSPNGLPRAKHLAVSYDGSVCVIDVTGAVVCAGPTPEPALTRPGIAHAVDLAAGAQHFCAVDADGKVSCWGENGWGQCGASNPQCAENTYGDCAVGRTRLPLAERAVAVAAGRRHSCAILASGHVACWGDDTHDELGVRVETACHPYYRGFCAFTPVTVPGISNATQLGIWGSNTWARLEGGKVVTLPSDRPAAKRRLGEPCRDLTARTSQDIIEHHDELRTQRVRLRGQLGSLRVLQRTLPAIGSVVLHELLLDHSDMAPGEELIVDGRVVDLGVLASSEPEPGERPEIERVPAVSVFDVCRVPR